MAIWDCNTRTSATSVACASLRYCTTFCSDRLMKSASVRCDSKRLSAGRPRRGGGARNCGLRVVLVVGLTAAGLGEAAADHVADGQDRHVQPRLPGAEAAVVGLVDHAGGDQDAGQHGEEGEELGRLERRLGLRGQATRGALGMAVALGTIGPRGGLNCAHGSSRGIANYENWTAFPTSATRRASFVPAKQKDARGTPCASYVRCPRSGPVPNARSIGDGRRTATPLTRIHSGGRSVPSGRRTRLTS